MWVGLIQSVEGVIEQKSDLHQQMAFGLELQHWLFPGSPVDWPTLQILDLPVSTTEQANLKSSLSTYLFMYVFMYVCMYLSIYPHPIGFVSLENLD